MPRNGVLDIMTWINWYSRDGYTIYPNSSINIGRDLKKTGFICYTKLYKSFVHSIIKGYDLLFLQTGGMSALMSRYIPTIAPRSIYACSRASKLWNLRPKSFGRGRGTSQLIPDMSITVFDLWQPISDSTIFGEPFRIPCTFRWRRHAIFAIATVAIHV